VSARPLIRSSSEPVLLVVCYEDDILLLFLKFIKYSLRNTVKYPLRSVAAITKN
jgi:hypothetical protein